MATSGATAGHPAVTFRAAEAGSLTDTEVRQLHDLLQATFGRWPGLGLAADSLDHFRWKLEGAGAGETAVYLVESAERGFVGLQLRIPVVAWLLGAPRRAALAADSAIHPDFQGKGIHRARHDHFKPTERERFQLVAGVSGNGAVLHVVEDFLMIGDPMQVLVKPLHRRRLVASEFEHHRMRMPAIAAVAAVALVEGATRLRHPVWRSPSNPALRLERVATFDERFDALFEATRRQFDLIHERSSDYLNWRYADPRSGEFVTIAATDHGRLVGYVVTKGTGSRGHIPDLLALPGRLDAVAALVDDAVGRIRATGAPAIICWMAKRHPYAAVLRSRGFFDSRRDSHAYIQAHGLTAAERDPLLPPTARVHLTHGDTDVV